MTHCCLYDTILIPAGEKMEGSQIQFLFLLYRLQSRVKSSNIPGITNWSGRTRMITEMWSEASEITDSSNLLEKRRK